uniref:Uncharacterized protein n=1 Tax=Romanomermis culicivorax TaxID=13658 RepID=A0A915HPY3_ROMCU
MPCDDVKLRNQEKISGPRNDGSSSIDQDLLEKDLPPLITVEDEVKAFDLSSEVNKFWSREMNDDEDEGTYYYYAEADDLCEEDEAEAIKYPTL